MVRDGKRCGATVSDGGDGEGGAECRIPADLQIPADI